MTVRSLSLCNLVAIWVETLFYGIYVTLLIPTVNVLLFRPLSSRSRALLDHDSKLSYSCLAGTFAIFTFSTVHLALGLSMLLEAFIFFPNISSEYYFSRITSSMNIVRTVVFLATVTIADVLMIRRVYAVWHRSVIISLIPLFGLALVITTGIFTISVPGGRASPTSLPASFSGSINLSSLFTPSIHTLLPVHLGILFATNLTISTLLCIRVCRRAIFTDGDGWTLRIVLVIIGEIGLIFPFIVLIGLLWSITHTNGQIILYTVLTPLAAVTITVMILATELYTICPQNSTRSHYPRPRADELPTSSTARASKVSMATASSAPRLSISTSDHQLAMSHNSPSLNPYPSTGFISSLETPSQQRPQTHQWLKAGTSPLTVHRQFTSATDSVPQPPRTPPPVQTQFPFLLEAQLSRSNMNERYSQQTFNPAREGAGQGGTAVTKFGNSSLARKLEELGGIT